MFASRKRLERRKVPSKNEWFSLRIKSCRTLEVFDQVERMRLQWARERGHTEQLRRSEVVGALPVPLYSTVSTALRHKVSCHRAAVKLPFARPYPQQRRHCATKRALRTRSLAPSATPAGGPP
jgi:hypothetical protein